MTKVDPADGPLESDELLDSADALDDGAVRDELPEDLNAVEYVGPYVFPNNNRRRIPGVLYIAMGLIFVLLWLFVKDSAMVNAGWAWGGAALIAVGLYNMVAGWSLKIDENDALVEATRSVGFPVGHASAQLGWRGWLSRPTWRILLYSNEQQPEKRGLVLIDGNDGEVLDTIVEKTPKTGASMFDGNWRETVEKGVDPIGEGLRKMGISADVMTVIGILMSVATAFVIGNGYLVWGFVAMVATGIPDLLDGAVAKASGSSSKRGAFFDSSIDRFSDAFVFGGLTWYLASNEPGRISVLPVAVMAAALITSYLRAKGELLGYDAKGGIMERAERFILVCVGLVFNDFLIPVLWIMLVLTCVTVAQRFAKIWKQATVEMHADRAAAAAGQD